jgi:SAM-dependent methyltransferase
VNDEEFAAQMRQRSRSFDAWALEYDRYRPTYPQALFDHVARRLVLPEHADVADLGAGTGKAARQMARRGWHVTAVEPGEGMLDVLRSRAQLEGLPIETHLAPAENTGLPDASFDLATVAQAFHWFDKAKAIPEVARIVRPGGGIAVFWNSRVDERSDFLADGTRVIERYVPERHVDKRTPNEASTTRADLAAGSFFDVDERVAIPHEIEMSRDGYVSYVFTASQVRLFVEGANQARLREDFAELIDRYFPDGRVVVPYDVELYVGTRTAKGFEP